MQPAAVLVVQQSVVVVAPVNLAPVPVSIDPSCTLIDTVAKKIRRYPKRRRTKKRDPSLIHSTIRHCDFARLRARDDERALEAALQARPSRRPLHFSMLSSIPPYSDDSRSDDSRSDDSCVGSALDDNECFDDYGDGWEAEEEMYGMYRY